MERIEMEPTVVVTSRGTERIRRGHPWVYRADVADVRADGGTTVLVSGPRGRVLGRALFSDRSEIALRMLTTGDQPAGLEVWRARLERAIAYRATLEIDATACRLVHGEADLLPSLIVDRYDEYLVVQTLSQGTDRLRPDIVRLLVELAAPAGILARNDPRVRRLEGLDPCIELLHGTVPNSVIVREGVMTFDVDLWRGQKTGMFLDQRENRRAAVAYARGRALDCFTYQGGFALAVAPRCDTVVALDASDVAVTAVGRNAERNGVRHVEARTVNVFDELRELERSGQMFDTIMLDPPAFAKNKAAVPKAIAGYKEINLRAMKLLSPGGHLVTCSCSYNIDERTFTDIVTEAAVDARATMCLVEKRLQARDHPVLVTVPETAYLKCLVLRKLDA